AFVFEFEAVELNSDRAETMRNYYIERQARQHHSHNSSVLNPYPKQRVLELLDKLESGDLESWGQLNMEMALESNGQYYDNKLDLTKLSGWQAIKSTTFIRIVECAEKYIQQKWIDVNNLNYPAIEDCR
ncbi:MAG: hypothetical protein ACK56I_22730, partial [bacterium]